jgi:penicillin amidase
MRDGISIGLRGLIVTSIAMACAAVPAQQPGRVTMHAAGLQDQAEILVDRWGVPHIYARSVEDVFFMQGFNAARERLFQIDLWRRRGLGQLAEVLGPAYVEQDAATRLFLYRGDMKAEWAAYGPDAEQIATAFARGINAYVDWLADHADEMPPEFKLLGYRPSRWNPADVVRIRSNGLTRNLASEVARASTVCRTDRQHGLKYDATRVRLQPPWMPEIPAGLDPCLPPDVLRVFRRAAQNVSFTRDDLVGTLVTRPQAGSHLEESPGQDFLEGSNNWAIAPSRSATGRPILANDPHRAYSTPSLRYIVHLNAPGLNIVGAGEPALPGISIGHNGTIGFGLTIFSIDQEDLYVYELNAESPRQYRYRGGWEEMRVVSESIAVKNAAPVVTDLVFTRHGPVIHSNSATRRAYALRTCWLEPGMSPYFGSIGYMRATSFREFQRAMLRWGAPSENLVYADVAGNVGWVAGGLAPIRPNWDGLMPVPGDGRYEWTGFWSGDKLPFTYNPSAGYVTTSNQMNLPAGYPYRERKLGFEWANDSRHQRIEEVIRGRSGLTIEDSLLLQNDYTSIPARRLLVILTSLAPIEEKARAAIDLLRGWDAVVGADSAQAALMEVWISRHLPPAFVLAVLPRNAVDAISSVDTGVMVDALERPEGVFVTDSQSSAAQKRDRVVLDSLAAAYADVENMLGTNSGDWRWGRLLHALPEHPLLNVLDAGGRGRFQPGSTPSGGSPHTPNQSGYRASDFRRTNGASFRMVLDVGNWDNSRAVNFPGQSGSPASAHYKDLVEMWRDGRYFPLLYTRPAVETVLETTIQVVPAR